MNIIDRVARWILLRLLAHAHGGELTIVEGQQRMRFGEIVPERPVRAVLQVHSPRFYRALLRGSVGLCDSYLERRWDCEDLVSLARFAALNVSALDRARRVLAPVTIPFQRWLRWLSRNTPRRARRRVAAHYDLGNELFSLFLDPTMMYSCAVFDSPEATLQEASLAKLERVCVKLDLRPEDHVLEIGSGWGGFAIYAAEHYGCRVTTTTISREQHAYTTERVCAAALQDRVTVLLEDYRDRSQIGRHGRYDKLVSIEMIEAVGWQFLGTYFRRCSELLRADGAMLLQAIVIDDRAYHVEKAAKSFINTYIFPGGCLPSLGVIARTLARVTDLHVVHMEDITPHYAETLARWRERFAAGAEHLYELGYDERFRRLWDLYLSYCEGGFRERRIESVQLLLAKPSWPGRDAAGSWPEGSRLYVGVPAETLSLSASSTK
ncbi:MAG TPA: cyclopropane-fatty-acyl-phospholipid synthase family protein [Solirubrobacteraceae bacterium]